MTTPSVWSDFEHVVGELRSLTVVYLKHVISGFLDEGVASLPRTGKKGEIMDRIVRALRLLQTTGQTDKWIKARAVILQAASGVEYDHHGLSRFLISPTSMPNTNGEVGTSVSSRNIQPPTPTQRSAPLLSSSTGPQHYATATRPTYPIPGPSRPEAPRWRFSPFYRIDQVVSPVQECLESTSSTDRRSARFNFYLTQDQLAKLNSTKAKYQLRLYCTTSQYYITTGTAFRNTLCPVEFPPTCEVRVNNQVVSGNFRGIKKKAGTAPPADITKFSRTASGQGNQVEMIYVNSNQPAANKQRPPPQKYYLVVNLVEVTSVDELVERLKKRVQPREEVIARMRAIQPDDDDVQVGPTKVSLRDPLTYTRLTLPCRASSCVHIGCFDAACWYSMMEQTTTWLCPICDRVLDVNELVIDGYIQEILANVDEEADDVMVEADGEWHTEDNKYGSTNWMSKYGTPNDADVVKAKPEPTAPTLNAIPAGANAIEIGDSSDSEEERIERQLSPIKPSPIPHPAPERRVPTHSASSASSAPLVIDLTISDSEEEEPQRPSRPVSSVLPPMPPSSLGKRKFSDDGDMINGSSRRTSTAPSHRSNGIEGDDYHQPPPYYYQNPPPMALRSPSSPSMPRHTSNGSSPGVYPYYQSNATPSPTAQSPNQQWPAAPRPITLPPASSLLASAPLTSPHSLSTRPLVPSAPLTSPSLLARPLLNGQQHYTTGPRLQRPYDNERPPPPRASSASSRYAEWGLKP